MKTIPKKNCKKAAVGFSIAAACFGGAAIIYAKSSKPGLAALYCSVAALYLVGSVLFFKKSKQQDGK